MKKSQNSAFTMELSGMVPLDVKRTLWDIQEEILRSTAHGYERAHLRNGWIGGGGIWEVITGHRRRGLRRVMVIFDHWNSILMVERSGR
jgi:hypothetical protein